MNIDRLPAKWIETMAQTFENSATTPALPWRALDVFTFYRLFLALVLLVTFGLAKFGAHHFLQSGIYFLIVLSGYLISSLFVFLGKKFLGFVQILSFSVCADIIFLSLLIYLDPDFVTVLGILINITIAAGSVLSAGRLSLAFAAFAVFSLFFVTVFLPNQLSNLQIYYQSGVLGITFFATALVAVGLSRRVRQSENLVKEKTTHLEQALALNKVVIEKIPAGVIALNEHDEVQLMNRFARQLLCLPGLMGKPNLGTVAPSLMQSLLQWKENQQGIAASFALPELGILPHFTYLKKGQQNAGVLILLEDAAKISAQSQELKLISLGRLTASIAHEMRNPLSAIMHAAQLLDEESADKVELLHIIQTNAKRVNEIIENILQLSRRKKAVPSKIELGKFLQNFKNQFEQSHDLHPEVHIILDHADLHLFIDESQLFQILFNLADNGVRYSYEHTGKAYLKIVASQNAAGGIVIDVIDQGKGINEQDAQFIFEPFFTTKSQGTGLGLYMVKELCEANRGSVSYQRIKDDGSCFKLIFSDKSLGEQNE